MSTGFGSRDLIRPRFCGCTDFAPGFHSLDDAPSISRTKLASGGGWSEGLITAGWVSPPYLCDTVGHTGCTNHRLAIHHCISYDFTSLY